MPHRIESTDALVVVDPQNDFLPGGALAVADGDRIFDPINRIAPYFAHVVVTRDWHPDGHTSFAAQGGPWPPHCIAGTTGAAFSPLLSLAHVTAIISKGDDIESDGYSAFAETELASTLRALSVTRIFIAGLATDYCVKMTALESAARGFRAVVLTDAIAAVYRDAGEEASALAEMRAGGVDLIASTELEWSDSA